MALSLQKSACVQARAGARPVQALRPLTVRRSVVRVAASKKVDEQLAAEFGKVATLSAVASSWMFSGHAQAATELANVAASDNRLGTIALLFAPVVGWVAFNMAQPALNQLARQNEIKEEAAAATGRSGSKKKRGVAGAVGLGAALSLFAAQNADAATELSQLAASDNRLSTISLLFLPMLAWVGFNMLQPATNQLNRMNALKEAAAGASSSGRKKRGVAGAVGLGAALSLFAAQNADAATELSQLAASDNRLGTIALLFAPVVGWVGFNIAQPALNQLARQNEIKEEAASASSSGRKKRGVAGAVGLGAALSLFAAQNADAATELSQLAASDNRLGTIALLFAPVVGWVGFNIAQPALNQLARQNEIKEEAASASSSGRKKRGVAGAVGLGAALSLFAAQNADAATELSQLAASDNRLSTIALLFLPVVGWVGFNILQPAFNQLKRQAEIKEEAEGSIKKASKAKPSKRR
ncbi:hypothetical protein OEZ85_013547 [Tetradesmus obliquus]|uniref:Uncharacterized protein n=1 Tax=Tetradesmus obliquus TaxID=3088 RepID=A0ABY8UWI8_TETOB|nr:hypothetical protein OEZ85_013547 [Tetradesmus obliquus]